jgi:hypothetical protein
MGVAIMNLGKGGIRPAPALQFSAPAKHKPLNWSTLVFGVNSNIIIETTLFIC